MAHDGLRSGQPAEMSENLGHDGSRDILKRLRRTKQIDRTGRQFDGSSIADDDVNIERLEHFGRRSSRLVTKHFANALEPSGLEGGKKRSKFSALGELHNLLENIRHPRRLEQRRKVAGVDF